MRNLCFFSSENDQKIAELAQLLRHGSSRVKISHYGQVINFDCTDLWVEIHTEKRIRLNKLVFGSYQVAGFLRSLPDGEYTGKQLLLLYMTTRKEQGNA